MPNSVERSSKSKKNNFDNFIWSDDQVELLLNVVLEYKTARTMENVGWETCWTKYVDILDKFLAQYLFVIKLTRANARLFNARETLLTMARFRFFTSSFLYLRGFVVHTKTIFTRVNIFTLQPSFSNLLGYVWTEAVTVKIFTRFQIYTGTCGRGQQLFFLRPTKSGGFCLAGA